jgi:hypothetical protein
MKLVHFLTVADGVEILKSDDETYMCFISDLDVCNDGAGPSHGDPHHQSKTTYNPYLNAEKDYYIVYQPKMRTAIKPIFLGCMGRVTNLRTREWHWGVWGDCGPADKTGEASHVLAKHVGPTTIKPNIGDKNKIYLYEAWPAVAAKVGDKQYKLIPAG